MFETYLTMFEMITIIDHSLIYNYIFNFDCFFKKARLRVFKVINYIYYKSIFDINFKFFLIL